MKSSFQLVTTGDGSHTLFVPHLNEHYHSKFGALSESLFIFINAGLKSVSGLSEISVFEIGFGTGLNAMLTLDFALENNKRINYHTIEQHPLDESIITSLNYAGKPGMASQYFLEIHKASWNEYIPITPKFMLHKILADFTSFEPGFRYDVIYFDAFAPDKQPEMWKPQLFVILASQLNPGGVLVTYCVKGEVKRALRNAGLTVQILPGPAGKRHILRAVKE